MDIRQLKVFPGERNIFTEADNDDAFPMLRAEMTSVDDLVPDVITEVILQYVDDGCECAPLVMADEVFDVLQQECLWALCLDDAGDIEKQGSLGLVFEAMGAT